MTHWSEKHRSLAIAVLVFALAAIACHIYLLRPRARKVQALQSQVDSQTAAIRERGWPVDFERLQAVRGMKEKELAELQSRSERIVNLAASTFQQRINDRFETPENFMNHVTRLDFQEYFSRISQELANRDIVLHEEMLKLSERSVSANVYQLVLQLWTVEKLVKLAVEHNLAPMKVPVTIDIPEEGGVGATGLMPGPPKTRRETLYVSKITLQPVKSYYILPTDEKPFVLEIPMTMTVRCTTAELYRFLEAVNQADTFIPINLIQVRKLPPFRNQATPDLLRVDLECSTFFKPDASSKIETRPVESIRALPRGA